MGLTEFLVNVEAADSQISYLKSANLRLQIITDFLDPI
jgi:hypothetical protein